MKTSTLNLRLTTLALATTLALTACGGSDNNATGNTPNNPDNPSQPDQPTTPPVEASTDIVVTGTVTDSNGNPLTDAIVTNGKLTAQTDANGNYELTLDGDGNEPTSTVVMVKKDGYLTTARKLIVSSNQAYDLDISLSTDQVSTAFVSSAGVADLNVSGANVSIPANAVVTADGSDFNGTVNISASYYNPDSIEGMQAFAQPFAGQNEDGSSQTALVTVGVIDVKLTDPATGAELNLKEGKTATLTFPEATTDQDLASIPLWYYDEEKLIWVKDGVATRQADGSYQGTVSHFTLWNVDIPVGEYSALLEGCVTGDDANKLANDFHAGIVGRGYVNYGGVDAQGKFSIQVPINTPLTLSPRYTPYKFDAISIPALEQDTTYQINDGTCIDVSKKDQDEVVDIEEITELPPVPIQLPVNEPTDRVFGYNFDFELNDDTLKNVTLVTTSIPNGNIKFTYESLYLEVNLEDSEDFYNDLLEGQILTRQGVSQQSSGSFTDNKLEYTILGSSIRGNQFIQSLDNGFRGIVTMNDKSISGLNIGDVLFYNADEKDFSQNVVDDLNNLSFSEGVFTAGASCKVIRSINNNTDHITFNGYGSSGDFEDELRYLDLNPTRGTWAGIPWAISESADEDGDFPALVNYNNLTYEGYYTKGGFVNLSVEDRTECTHYNEIAKENILNALAKAYPEL